VSQPRRQCAVRTGGFSALIGEIPRAGPADDGETREPDPRFPASPAFSGWRSSCPSGWRASRVSSSALLDRADAVSWTQHKPAVPCLVFRGDVRGMPASGRTALERELADPRRSFARTRAAPLLRRMRRTRSPFPGFCWRLRILTWASPACPAGGCCSTNDLWSSPSDSSSAAARLRALRSRRDAVPTTQGVSCARESQAKTNTESA
jgi:hypothetical protein